MGVGEASESETGKSAVHNECRCQDTIGVTFEQSFVFDASKLSSTIAWNLTKTLPKIPPIIIFIFPGEFSRFAAEGSRIEGDLALDHWVTKALVESASVLASTLVIKL